MHLTLTHFPPTLAQHTVTLLHKWGITHVVGEGIAHHARPLEQAYNDALAFNTPLPNFHRDEYLGGPERGGVTRIGQFGRFEIFKVHPLGEGVNL